MHKFFLLMPTINTSHHEMPTDLLNKSHHYFMPTTFHSRNTWENERNLFSLESTWHENIVHFITCESSDSRGVISASPLQLYLVTEYYPLGSLEGYLRGNRLSWKQACTIVRDVACGLKHLHSEFYLNENGIRTEKYSIAHR